ncbi:HYC_CC_PP family protein [Flaviaesturariibacter amylovorans]|uniref:Uncharacterized protein n=1 Tax=Flaviaesturariibacter amylovorans TaxID=1084520 RepID=A0ABP8GM24_9BACT
MKKAITIFVLAAYFLVSSGFVVNLHFCMDRFDSWELGASDRHECGTCGMKVKKGACCHDEVKVVKVQQDATGAYYALLSLMAPAEVPSFASLFLVPELVPAQAITPPAHGPPLLSRQDTYLRNCVFRL